MVIPAITAMFGGQGLSQMMQMGLRRGALGSILGGGLGGIFGGRGGGFNTALRRSLEAKRESLKSGVQNFEMFGQRFMDQFQKLSPVYGALQSRAMSDLDDASRTARLEMGFQRRLGQQQASRGLYRSPSAALQSSFAGLQFQEQLRQQAFQNAMGFQSQLSQPLVSGFFQAGMPNIQGDIGFQQQAFDYGAGQARNQSILSGLSEGWNSAIGFGRMNFGQRQQSAQS